MGLLVLRDWSIGFTMGSHFGWDSGSVFGFAGNCIGRRPRNCVWRSDSGVLQFLLVIFVWIVTLLFLVQNAPERAVKVCRSIRSDPDFVQFCPDFCRARPAVLATCTSLVIGTIYVLLLLNADLLVAPVWVRICYILFYGLFLKRQMRLNSFW